MNYQGYPFCAACWARRYPRSAEFIEVMLHTHPPHRRFSTISHFPSVVDVSEELADQTNGQLERRGDYLLIHVANADATYRRLGPARDYPGRAVSRYELVSGVVAPVDRAVAYFDELDDAA